MRIDILNFLAERERETKIFFIIFYLVGILGLGLSITHQLFIKLIPFALILSFLGLLAYHSNKPGKKSTLVFSGILIAGFIIEVIGVHTSLIFGEYQYGKSLGFKVLNTPVMIGINWLFLVYASSSIVEKLKLNLFIKILIASVIMLVYDMVLEQVAPKTDMWSWKNELVPVRNYIAWFVISLIFQSMIKVFRIPVENRMSSIILSCQFLFFLVLFFILS